MPTTIQNMAQDVLDPSSAILLAEHERLASLYQLNAEMGDRFVTTYLTIVSVVVALIAALGELKISSDTLVPIEVTLLVIILAIGTITFTRLIERRTRGIEYLRAINRIHCYFVARDAKVREYLYWPPSDDRPPMQAKGTVLGGLRDIVAGVNSLVLGLAAGIMAKALWPSLHYLVLVLAGSILRHCRKITFLFR